MIWLQEHSILIMRLLNFALMAGLMLKFAVKPLGNMIGGLCKEISDALEQGINENDAAKAKVADNEKLLAGADTELETMMRNTEKRVHVVNEEIQMDAEHELQRWDTLEAERLRSITLHGRKSIKMEFANKSITLAEKLIHTNRTPDDHKKWIKDFMERLA